MEQVVREGCIAKAKSESALTGKPSDQFNVIEVMIFECLVYVNSCPKCLKMSFLILKIIL